MTCSEKLRLVNAFVETKDFTTTSSLYRKNIVLYAEKDAKGFKGCIGEGRLEIILVPKLYICEECGHIEYALDKSQIEKFKEIEKDESYHKTNLYL